MKSSLYRCYLRRTVCGSHRMHQRKYHYCSSSFTLLLHLGRSQIPYGPLHLVLNYRNGTCMRLCCLLLLSQSLAGLMCCCHVSRKSAFRARYLIQKIGAREVLQLSLIIFDVIIDSKQVSKGTYHVVTWLTLFRCLYIALLFLLLLIQAHVHLGSACQLHQDVFEGVEIYFIKAKLTFLETLIRASLF